ncbi:DUF2960 family protein [Paraferrimonas sp. SM1919]|uniref:DUF2960 family protein n=1 Tax=Paraferrimonas sp. SM1919 TaxID=2662263 RepID=UPI0013D3CAD6|nr:DUF2960 family protein [Paraferrimonas sp. SM1919]
MAFFIEYTFKGKNKTIGFANDRHHDMFSAVCKEEGLDLNLYLDMEQQLRMSTRDKVAIRNFRDNYFKNLGLTKIQVIRKE